MCPQIWTLADFALTLRNPTWAWRADKFDHPEKPATSCRKGGFIGDGATLCSDCKTFSQISEISQPTYQANKTTLRQFFLKH
jgi:hypothetical protein